MSEGIAVVVQCRMGSTRLPGKALLEIEGVPLLRRLCNRVATARRTNLVVVATSDRAADDQIEGACRSWGVEIHRGPEADLIERFLGVVERYDLSAFVRVTGDNPLTDPVGIDELIAAFHNRKADLVHNKHLKGYPYGTGAELITANALRRCSEMVHNTESREDFVTWMRKGMHGFQCESVSADPALVRPDYFLTVDYPEDFELFVAIYRRFAFDDLIPLGAVIEFLDNHPRLLDVNRPLHTPFAE